MKIQHPVRLQKTGHRIRVFHAVHDFQDFSFSVFQFFLSLCDLCVPLRLNQCFLLSSFRSQVSSFSSPLMVKVGQAWSRFPKIVSFSAFRSFSYSESPTRSHQVPPLKIQQRLTLHPKSPSMLLLSFFISFLNLGTLLGVLSRFGRLKIPSMSRDGVETATVRSCLYFKFPVSSFILLFPHDLPRTSPTQH